MGLLVFLERLAARLGSGVRNETTINGDVSHAITGGSFNRSSINIGSSAKTLVNILREQQADKEIAEFRAAVRETKDRFDRTTSISSENPFVTLSGIKFTGVPS